MENSQDFPRCSVDSNKNIQAYSKICYLATISIENLIFVPQARILCILSNYDRNVL